MAVLVLLAQRQLLEHADAGLWHCIDEHNVIRQLPLDPWPPRSCNTPAIARAGARQMHHRVQCVSDVCLVA
jgi:hypothetical protein